MKKGVPISPSDIPAAKATVIPTEVFDVVNELLVVAYRNGHAILYQKDIEKAIQEKMGNCQLEWLDFEDVYRKAGWVVKYDRPAYCESYDAFFEFANSH